MYSSLNIFFHCEQVLSFQTLVGNFVHNVLYDVDTHTANLALHWVYICISIIFHCWVELAALIAKYKSRCRQFFLLDRRRK